MKDIGALGLQRELEKKREKKKRKKKKNEAKKASEKTKLHRVNNHNNTYFIEQKLADETDPPQISKFLSDKNIPNFC